METGLVKLNPELMALIHDKGGAGIIPFKQEIFVINVFVAGTGYCEKNCGGTGVYYPRNAVDLEAASGE